MSEGALNGGAESLPIDPATPLFRVRSFNLLFITRVASTTAFQMIAVVVGWHVYELMAEYISAIGSAAIGGVAIIATVALWAFMFPALLRVDRPDEPQLFDRITRRG